MLRRLLALALLTTALLSPLASQAGDVSVRGYMRKDGTSVQPHRRSTPNRSFNDNWTTRPNVNPYTGASGTRTTPPTAPSWRAPRWR